MGTETDHRGLRDDHATARATWRPQVFRKYLAPERYDQICVTTDTPNGEGLAEVFFVGDVTARFPGDFDGDFKVGFSDFILFAGAFGSQAGDESYQPLLDMTTDGVIDFPDFIQFAKVFGTEYLQTE